MKGDPKISNFYDSLGHTNYFSQLTFDKKFKREIIEQIITTCNELRVFVSINVSSQNSRKELIGKRKDELYRRAFENLLKLLDEEVPPKNNIYQIFSDEMPELRKSCIVQTFNDHKISKRKSSLHKLSSIWFGPTYLNRNLQIADILAGYKRANQGSS